MDPKEEKKMETKEETKTKTEIKVQNIEVKNEDNYEQLLWLVP